MNGANPSTLTGLLGFAVFPAILLVLSAACTATGDGSDQTPRNEDSPTNLTFAEVQTGASGSGSEAPRLLITDEPGLVWDLLQLPDTPPDDRRTYIAVSSGQRNTGGYSVTVERITSLDGRVKVVVSESEPPDGSRVTQALTFPYSVVAVEGLAEPGLRETTFVAVNPNGKELGWTTEIVGG